MNEEARTRGLTLTKSELASEDQLDCSFRLLVWQSNLRDSLHFVTVGYSNSEMIIVKNLQRALKHTKVAIEQYLNIFVALLLLLFQYLFIHDLKGLTKVI